MEYEPEEELRRDDLTRIVNGIKKWPCMQHSKNLYEVAGQIMIILKGKDTDFAIQLLKDKSSHLRTKPNVQEFYKFLTGIYRKDSHIGEIESRSHLIDDGTERGGEMKSISKILRNEVKDVIERNE